jgi:hypothetical protein
MTARASMDKTPHSSAATRSAAARLTEALAMLTHQNNGGSEPRNATITELCRLACVSRNSLYRYHTGILKALHTYQHRRRTAKASKFGTSHERLHAETVVLREQITKLAALVDHYYAAYRETSALLTRREREIAALRRDLHSKPMPLPR